jgi:hypothetical protein
MGVEITLSFSKVLTLIKVSLFDSVGNEVIMKVFRK